MFTAGIMRCKILFRLPLAVILVALCFGAAANDNRPLFIELTEQKSQGIELRWKVPLTVSPANRPSFLLPGCTALQSTRFFSELGQQYYRCETAIGSGSLAAASLEIVFPQSNPMLATLLRINWNNGETRTLSVSPGQLTIHLPEPETAGGVAWQYFVLGVEHIWMGYDHLLFIACLIVIAGTLKKMLITVTGFTLAHSVTLVLAALELVRLPIVAVEVTIALSIVFLATELVRNRRTTLTWRYPVVVSSTFGLLHGFGFAAVLEEIGLPQTELGLGLLFFNLGVEAGQVAFTMAILVALWLLARIWQPNTLQDIEPGQQVIRFNWGLGHYQMLTGYVVGSLASYWMVERLLSA